MERKIGETLDRRARRPLEGYHLAEDSARQAELETVGGGFCPLRLHTDDDDDHDYDYSDDDDNDDDDDDSSMSGGCRELARGVAGGDRQGRDADVLGRDGGGQGRHRLPREYNGDLSGQSPPPS